MASPAAPPRDTAAGTLHLVSAWAADNGVILGQEAVGGGSHEIAAIPWLLRALDLEGALVTIDVAGCRKEIAARIIGQGGDSLLAAKGNQPALRAAAVSAFGALLGAELGGIRHSRGLNHGFSGMSHGTGRLPVPSFPFRPSRHDPGGIRRGGFPATSSTP